MKPTDTLVDEHRLIEQVLNCLERMAERASRRAELDARRADDAIAFLKTFVHGWHIPREEAYLSQAMVSLSESRPEDLAFHDHRRCCTHLGEMELAAAAGRAGESGAAERFAEHAHAYIAVLMKHIEDEEVRLFPRIEDRQTEPSPAERAILPEPSLAQPMDRGQFARYTKAANRLADHYNVPRAGGLAMPVGPAGRAKSAVS